MSDGDHKAIHLAHLKNGPGNYARDPLLTPPLSSRPRIQRSYRVLAIEEPTISNIEYLILKFAVVFSYDVLKINTSVTLLDYKCQYLVYFLYLNVKTHHCFGAYIAYLTIVDVNFNQISCI